MTGAITPDLLAGTTSDSAPWMKLLLGGMFGAGELGNILQQHKQDAWQSYVMNLLKNPQQTSADGHCRLPTPLPVPYQVDHQCCPRGDRRPVALANPQGYSRPLLAQALAPYQQAELQHGPVVDHVVSGITWADVPEAPEHVPAVVDVPTELRKQGQWFGNPCTYCRNRRNGRRPHYPLYSFHPLGARTGRGHQQPKHWSRGLSSD